MDELYRKLYDAFVSPKLTPEERAAMERAKPAMERLRQVFSLDETDEISGAIMDIGAANLENNFVYGFCLGARMMLAVLGPS